MIKRSKVLLCALASVGIMTSFNTINANAMTMSSNTTTKFIKHTVSEVEKLMDKIPYTISTNLREQAETITTIIQARLSYNSLEQKDKDRVDYCSLCNLKHAELEAKDLIKDEVKASILVRQINQLEDDVNYRKVNNAGNNKCIAIDMDNKKVKDNKDNIQKIRNVYDSLDYSVKSKFVSNYQDFLKIECRLSQALWME